MHDLRAARFLDPLQRFILSGGLVYGGSAGAIILGRDIMTAAHIDPNDVGLHDTAGLDLLGGCSIWPHYTRDDDHRIAAYVEQDGFPVIALSERSGLDVHDGLPTVLGCELVLVFHVGTRIAYEPSSIIDL